MSRCLPGLAVLVLLAGLAGAQTNVPREVWVALRADGQAGAGTLADPFDAGSVEKLNALFDKFAREYGENLTVHFGPGVFLGDRMIAPLSRWKIRGAGMDVTIFRTRPDTNSIQTFGFRAGGYTGGPSGFEISDCTFDFNTPNLRQANRAFVYLLDGKTTAFGYPVLGYWFLDNPPAWAPDRAYQRPDVVTHNGQAFIAIADPGRTTPTNQPPAQSEFWSALHPNRPDQLPAWDTNKAYAVGEAVAAGGRAYICLAAGTTSAPAADAARWVPLNPAAPDPHIYTHAVCIIARPPGGQHRVSRVRAINGNGSWFLGWETFVFGLGGNDCVIEDCVVEQYHGDYSSLIIVSFGQHGVIRGCTVRGNNGLVTMAYGGWACWDTVFEDNFCDNVSAASNIDSLNCRNVTFRNNVFLNCRQIGILINVASNIVAGHETFSMPIDGRDVNISRCVVDGLFVYGNLVQMRDNAPYGAVQVQQDGLSNVRIANNVFRTESGAGKGWSVKTYRAVKNITVCGNTCEPGMRADVPTNAAVFDNYDFAGQPMPGLPNRRPVVP